ncbi:MAG: hypothetical protein QM765_36385 [Myxococcales bacterium]
MKDDNENDDVPASDDGATVMMGPDEQPHPDDEGEEEAEQAPLDDQATMLKVPEEPAEPPSDQATMLKEPAAPLLAVPPRPIRAVAKPAEPAPLDDQGGVATIVTAPKKATPKAPPRPEGLRRQKEQASPAMKLIAVALVTIAAIAAALFYLFGIAPRKAASSAPGAASASELKAPAVPAPSAAKADPASAPAAPAPAPAAAPK